MCAARPISKVRIRDRARPLPHHHVRRTPADHQDAEVEAFPVQTRLWKPRLRNASLPADGVEEHPDLRGTLVAADAKRIVELNLISRFHHFHGAERLLPSRTALKGNNARGGGAMARFQEYPGTPKRLHQV